MGFGILLLGYMLSFSLYPAYTDLFAYAVIFLSMKRLGVYNRYFLISKYSSAVISAVGAAGLFIAVLHSFGYISQTSVYLDVYDNISEGLKMAFHIPLLLGISEIARETDLPKYSSTAIWSIILDILYAIVYGLSFVEQRLLPYRMAMRGCLMIICAVLIFNCFRMICTEGDEKTPWYTVRLPGSKKNTTKTENDTDIERK